jgi:hypothetical protein
MQTQLYIAVMNIKKNHKIEPFLSICLKQKIQNQMQKTEKFYVFLKSYKKENDIIIGVVKLEKE